MIMSINFISQNVDNDEDMSGERGCYFKDGKRRIGRVPHPTKHNKHVESLLSC